MAFWQSVVSLLHTCVYLSVMKEKSTKWDQRFSGKSLRLLNGTILEQNSKADRSNYYSRLRIKKIKLIWWLLWIKWLREEERFDFFRLFSEFFAYKIRLGPNFFIIFLILRKELEGHYIFHSWWYLNIETKALVFLECRASDHHTDNPKLN